MFLQLTIVLRCGNQINVSLIYQSVLLLFCPSQSQKWRTVARRRQLTMACGINTIWL